MSDQRAPLGDPLPADDSIEPVPVSSAETAMTLEQQLQICEQNGARWINAEVSAIRAFAAQIDKAAQVAIRMRNEAESSLAAARNEIALLRASCDTWRKAKEAETNSLATARKENEQLKEALNMAIWAIREGELIANGDTDDNEALWDKRAAEWAVLSESSPTEGTENHKELK